MQRPFLLKVSEPVSEENQMYECDVPMGEEPLPAAVDLTESGYVLARGTLVTDVKAETTDDK